MFEEIDPLYVKARSALLDALIALESQKDSIVLVGAQAVYLRTGEADVGVAPYTIDGDLAIDPVTLGENPLLEEAMKRGGFVRDIQPGQWVRLGDVKVDLLVPQSLVPKQGSRGARIPPHDKHASRRVLGIEGCIIDNDPILITALDPADNRTFEVRVAGSGGLLVAKLFKISERLGTKRVEPKDAIDTFRLLRATSTSELQKRLEDILKSEVGGAVGAQAIGKLQSLFGAQDSPGTELLAESLQLFEDPAVVKASCVALVHDLLVAIGSGIKE